MPQISLYIDEEKLKKVKQAAGTENTSISKWVARQIDRALESRYPDNFEKLFGSIDDETFTPVDRASEAEDAERESI